LYNYNYLIQPKNSLLKLITTNSILSYE